MKRYECIKSGRFEMFDFRQGEPYNFDRQAIKNGVSFVGYRTIIGRIIWLNPDQIFEHFKELEPIDDLYENPLEDWHPLTLMEERQIPAWARIAVAVFISAIVLFLIATI